MKKNGLHKVVDDLSIHDFDNDDHDMGDDEDEEDDHDEVADKVHRLLMDNHYDPEHNGYGIVRKVAGKYIIVSVEND